MNVKNVITQKRKITKVKFFSIKKCDDSNICIIENNLEKHNKSNFHIDNHIKRKADKFRFCEISNRNIRKSNEVHGLTPTHKKQLK